MKSDRLIASAMIAACAAALFVLWPRERELASARPPSEEAQEPPPERALEVTAPGPGREQVEPQSVEDATPSVASAQAQQPRVPADAIDLRGRLIVLDPDGIERPSSQASFQLSAWQEDGDHWRTEVTVDHGSWTARATSYLGAIKHLTAAAFVVDGSRATLEAPLGNIAVPEDRWLELRVRLPRPTTLRVLAADTGADLDGVVLVRIQPFPRNDDEHPGIRFSERVAARGLRSPIDVGEALGSARMPSTLLVGCDGYAWNRTSLDVAKGGDRLVTLERGGDLDLRVVGADKLPKIAPPALEPGEWAGSRPTSVELRLRRRARGVKPMMSDELGTRDNVELAGLAPGHYWIDAEIGPAWQSPTVLGEVEVDIVAGERTSSTLVVRPPEVIEAVRVVGRVWVPSAWKCGSALITMHLLDTPQVGFEAYSRAQGSKQASEREGFDRFDWALGHVQPGRYELGVFQPPFSTAIVVEPRAGQEFDLVVPPPIEVSVRVVDADTGFDAVVHAVMWNPVRPEGVAGGGVQLAQRNEGTQRYELLASSSALEVFTLDERFNMVDDANASAKSYTVNGGSGLCTVRPATFDVSGPRAELVLRVRPVCGFVLRLREDETPVAVPEDWHVNVQPVSGRGRLVRERPEPPGWRCVVSEAGAYTVELLPLDGYLPIPQQTVTVMAGEFVEHVVELVREP